MRGLLVLLVLATPLAAQVTAGLSGLPGDGIPDIYFAPSNGLLVLDTDGRDFNSLLVADSAAHFFNGCLLCDGDSLLGPNGDHIYTVGNIGQSTQWVRVLPFQGPAPDGVFVVARGPTGLGQSYFEEIFDDQAESLWSAVVGDGFRRAILHERDGCSGL